MKTQTFTIRFNTPAFLGDAGQNGRWRTPPFKHLLREWWRVAWAMQNEPGNWRQMREVEGRLLGHAWLENDTNRSKRVSARKSKVLMRLSNWKPGAMQAMPKTKPAAAKAPASSLYLGYGPVKDATTLNMPHPIDFGESGIWKLAWPEVEGAEYLETALSLIDHYGALGGRSRNGWGSVSLNNSGPVTDARLFRSWRQCLDYEWAHAIGRDDDGPLIWKTPARNEWKHVIEDLGAIRKLTNAIPGNRSQRKLLNQPVGGKGDRLPSTLRFKVRKDDQGEFYGVIFHMPCLPPRQFRPDRQTIEQVWRQVHQYLDNHPEINRNDR